MAHNFLDRLHGAAVRHLPNLVHNVNTHLQRSIPGDFFEVRASPVSTFHLRPDEQMLGNVQDRSPFPRIANAQWVDESHNACVLYADESIDIHPFKVDGRILGLSIEDHIVNGYPKPSPED